MDYNQDIFFKMQQQQMPGKQPFYMTNPIQNLYMTELEYHRDLDRMKEMSPMEIRKVQERVMARQSIFKFNERVTTEAKDATYEFRGPVISVKNLEKKFGEHEVLKDISFDLFEGDVVCIIGSSGSGKSTLLRCINHLETPTSGQILYHGYPLTKDAQTINRFRSGGNGVPAVQPV